MRSAARLLLTVVFASSVSTAAAQQGGLTPIAVLDLTSRNVPEPEVRVLAERLRIELFRTGRFDVFERDRMAAILEEQGFQQSECVATECMVEVGQLVGVEKIVAGSVGRVGAIHTINVRLIDVQTGRLERIAVRDCACPLEEMLTRVIAEVAVELAGDAESPESVRQPEPVEPNASPLSPAEPERETAARKSPQEESRNRNVGFRTEARHKYDDSIYAGFPGIGLALMHPWREHTDIGLKCDLGSMEEKATSYDKVQLSLLALQAQARYNLRPGQRWNYFLQLGAGIAWVMRDHASALEDDHTKFLPWLCVGLGVNFGRTGLLLQGPVFPVIAVSYNF